jgi:hypothetical protein
MLIALVALRQTIFQLVGLTAPCIRAKIEVGLVST